MSASTVSNLFVFDALDTCLEVEAELYDSYIQLSPSSDLKQKVHAKIYSFLVTGDEEVLGVLSLIGNYQEKLVALSVRLLESGRIFKPHCFLNLVKAIDMCLAFIVQHNFLKSILISLFQYLSHFSSYDLVSEESLTGMLELCQKILKYNHFWPEAISFIVVYFGRVICESTQLNEHFVGFLNECLEFMINSNALLDKEVARTCLELCGKHDGPKRFLHYISNQNGAILSSLGISYRIPSYLRRYVHFILEKVSVTAKDIYISMLRYDLYGDELLIDLVRYIVLTQSLSSGSEEPLQKWQIIISIFKYLRSSPAVASAKLALYLDWLLSPQEIYTHETIFEPGCSLIFHGFEINRFIPISLLEFLYLCGSYFFVGQNRSKDIHLIFGRLVRTSSHDWKKVRLPHDCYPELRGFLTEMQSKENIHTVDDYKREDVEDGGHDQLSENLFEIAKANLRAIKELYLKRQRHFTNIQRD